MARVNQRLWKIPGQRTKRKAWGFTAQINGKQIRRYKAEWTQDDRGRVGQGAAADRADGAEDRRHHARPGALPCR
jgi:hypothetical protein